MAQKTCFCGKDTRPFLFSCRQYHDFISLSLSWGHMGDREGVSSDLNSYLCRGGGSKGPKGPDP